MLTPTEQRSLTFLFLLGAQKDAAVGCFSAIQVPTDDNTDRITSYFDRDMTATTRKFILGSCTAILFLENHIFKVLSSPSLTVVGRNNRQTTTGHFGDRILHPNPISISGDAAAFDVLVLAKKPIEGNAALQALMANQQVTDLLVTDADTNKPVMFPFPEMGADEDPSVTFADYYVSRLSVAVPLPMGHGVDLVSLEDGAAIEEFFKTLRSVSPHLEEWAQAMLKTTNFWDDLSLSATDIDLLTG
jgi:hypothetical protein